MITVEFIEELRKFIPITDKMILKYPITVLNTDSIDMLVNIDVSKFGCTEFEDMAFFEAQKLTNIASLFENPIFKRIGNTLDITSTSQHSVLTLADIDIMETYNQNPQIIESLVNRTTVAEFEITSDTVKRIKTASSIFSELNAVAIEGVDGDAKFYLDQHNKFNSTQNKFELEYLNSSSKDFKVKIGIENFTKLPVTDYTVQVKYNEEKDAYRILFKSEKFSVLVSKLAD